jgi:hypothetical protein
VADHSKWGVVSNFLLAKLDEVNSLIVDDGLDPEAVIELRSRGVQVIVAGPERGGATPSAETSEELSYAPVLKTR